MARFRWLARPLVIGFGLANVGAACNYSPPPLPSHGQGADTLGKGSAAVAVEAGRGTVASWWNADYLGDPDVSDGWVGAGRLRAGLSNDLDLGLVGAVGPERAFVAGPEVKWRFAHFSPPGERGSPGFHAAWVSGVGVGALELRGEAQRRAFVAPYSGVLASGGIEVVQMFVGLRFAVSEVLGNAQDDLTLYPMLGFGVQVKPTARLTWYAEGTVASGITVHDTGDTALLVYPSTGLTLTFDP
jgi:hypothetical protein